MVDKEQAKKEFNTKARMIIIAIIVVLISIILFSVIKWFLNKLDTKENDKDPKNAPAAARNFMNDTYIDENGKITLGKSIAEWWEELKKNGNKMTTYLNSPVELAKIMNAAMALDYPDTRKNPNKPIQWNDLDINSKEIQGIVKFKRALANGKNISMTYVTPTEFQELINKYQSSGDVKDRNEALKHFTIEKTSSTSNGDTGTAGKVPSLKGMVFMGDSILYCLAEKNDILKNEGAKFMYRGGCTAKYFLGKETADGLTNNCIEKNGYFDWDANFNSITNPTGFYLVLGQNFYGAKDKIDQMNELVEKIRKQYPTQPIFINSVLNTTEKGSEELATKMNEELKTYCSQKNNVYYSDVLSGFKEKITELADNEGGIYDHPNAKGAEVLVKNIKKNIIGSSSSIQEILKYACSWAGKVPYKSSVTKNDPNGERWMDLSEGKGSDCSHFVHKVFGHFGILDNSNEGFINSENWGKGGDAGGAPGTVKIGTDLTKASPGDVIWQDFGDGWHVQIYLGNNKVVECTSNNNYEGVRITKISNNHKIDQILHFSKLPTDTSAYFDPESGILHGSTSGSSNSSTPTYTSSSSSGSVTGTSGSSASTPEEIARITRSYNNDVFNVDKDSLVDPMQNMPTPSTGNTGTYRAVQSVCYDGTYVICAQNRNYGTVGNSSKGGRIEWINLETGKFEKSIEVGEEGGHMDSITYDSDRNMVLKVSSSKQGNLLQIDNSTKEFASTRYTNMSQHCADITYVPTIKQLVGLNGNKFIFMSYDSNKNEYVKQKEVQLDSFKMNTYVQSIGTDGQVIYIADSNPDFNSSLYRVWTYTLDGKKVEEHSLGSGFSRGNEVEAAFSDKDGNLWLACPQSVQKVLNYKANSANVNPGSTSTSSTANMTYQVKVATWSERQDKVSSNDPEVSSYDTGMIPSMTTTAIPYQAIVSKYKMPFNYLWTMLVYSQDKNYTFDLADLVKNSKIEITIHDNLNETTNIITDTYADFTKIHAEADVNISFENVNTIIKRDPITNEIITEEEHITEGSTTKHGTGEGNRIIKFKVVNTSITKTNTLDIALTLADAWCAKYEKKYTYNKPNTTENNSSAKLEAIVEDPYTKNGELGGQDSKVHKSALSQVSTAGRRNVHVTGEDKNKFATYQTSRINRVKNTYTKITTSSYFSAGGTNIARSEITTASTPKTGSLNPANYAALIEPSTHRDGKNIVRYI